MSDDSIGYMSPFDFASKIDWEGGVMSALDYGLKHDELDPNDPASAKLREAWKELETVHREHWRPARQKVSAAFDAIQGLDGGPEA